MHLMTILAFVCMFWRAELDEPWVLFSSGAAGAIALVIGYWTSTALIGLWCNRRALALMDQGDPFGERLQRFHHRATVAQRGWILLGFAGIVLGSSAYDVARLDAVSAWLQVFSDLALLSVYFVACALMWVTGFAVERRFRASLANVSDASTSGAQPFRLRTYLDANIRHHLLVVAAPMILILHGSNLIRAHEREIMRWTGSPWGGDVALGSVAAAVFVIAPEILRRVWRTEPLVDGPLRTDLEALCRRIGLRCRDILVWKGDGMSMNAAVMGVVAPLRYVLLSDTLIASMSQQQVEAVFGHEAGHVRHRHIEKFLVFAYIGWLGVAGVMELLAWGAMGLGRTDWLSSSTVQAIGLGTAGVLWLAAFGWVSRRFEWQADLFGARCAAPSGDSCRLPCAAHPGHGAPSVDQRVCMTGARVFASALERVALMNGIPREDPSWRHSSIARRVSHVLKLAGDPSEAARFDLATRRLSRGIWFAGTLGAMVCLWYWTQGIEPAMLRLARGSP